MNKEQVIDLLDLVDVLYPGKLKNVDASKMLEGWSLVLAKHDEETVKKNLIRHAESSPYLPSISDLVHKEASRVVPDFKETQDYIKKYENLPPPDEETKAVIEKAKRDIDKILDIKRER